MNVCELFLSIEGEGKRTGQPAVFVRKTLCPLRCSYCDSTYSFEKDPNGEYTVSELVQKVEEVSNGCKAVTFTGGEPLWCCNPADMTQTYDFVSSLVNKFEVNVETNGAIDLKQWTNVVRRNGFFTMDWKSVSSGMSNRMIESNLDVLDERDVLKFVVGSQEDLDQMKSVLDGHDVKAQVYVSPIFGMIEPKAIVQYVLDNQMWDVKAQIQIHKVIWNPNARGV